MAASAAACAISAPTPLISARQRQQFQATIARARPAASPWDCPSGDKLLRAAESDFFYADNSPGYPDRAARMAAQAQQEAQAAIDVCQPTPGVLQAHR